MFDRDRWKTKVTTNRITTKERVLGHMIGPGFVYVYYCVVLGLRELFYMDIMRINEVFHSNSIYLILTTVTTLIGIATGFFINHMIEKTVCRAGHFRPCVMIGIWIMAALNMDTAVIETEINDARNAARTYLYDSKKRVCFREIQKNLSCFTDLDGACGCRER